MSKLIPHFTLTKAANGHLKLESEDMSSSHWKSFSRRLAREYGASRVGQEASGPGQCIYQDFQLSTFTLLSGWDNWSGYYFLSQCDSGDEFLQILYDELRLNIMDGEKS